MNQHKRPNSGQFSSGPCSKRPGWNSQALDNAIVGRSHRSGICKSRIQQALDQSREILGIPADYLIGIVPGSDTGAMEIAMWNLLGATGVDVLYWESFSKDWNDDVIKHLGIKNANVHAADYGHLPDLTNVNFDNDAIFAWNGTTSGVKLANGDWIPSDRKGLTICDATSAAFAMELPWEKLDVTTYSWQKVLGGEAGFGMLVLSPRAVERLNSHLPTWPIPKLFRLRKGDKLDEGIFKGNTINTISMLCVEDYLDALKWAESVGGLAGLIQRSQENVAVIENWVNKTAWIDFLCVEAQNRSNTSVCLSITADWFTQLDNDQQQACMKSLTGMLEKEGIAFDINGYRAAPPGLRIWAGATVETADITDLLPWIEWAFQQVQDAQ
jgi:phosphoserine aminotransferase